MTIAGSVRVYLELVFLLRPSSQFWNSGYTLLCCCREVKMFHQPTYLSCFVLLFNLQLRVTFGIPDCGQTYSGPSRFKPCSFPFTYEGVEHNECIDVQDPGKFWCSIHPNGTYGRAEGLWGYCHFRCYRAKVAATTATTVRPTSTLSDMVGMLPSKNPLCLASNNAMLFSCCVRLDRVAVLMMGVVLPPLPSRHLKNRTQMTIKKKTKLLLETIYHWSLTPP